MIRFCFFIWFITAFSSDRFHEEMYGSGTSFLRQYLLVALEKNRVVCPGATMSKRMAYWIILKKKNNNNPPKIAILGSGAKVDHLFSPTLYHYLLFILVVCQKLAFLQSSLIQIGKYRKCCFGFSTFFLFFFIIITWMGDNSFHDKNAPAKIMSVIFEL